MLKAVVEGNWTVYKALYDNWVQVNGGSISFEKFNEVFLYNQRGSVLRRLIDKADLNQDTHNIVKHILDNLHAFEISLDTALNLAQYSLDTEPSNYYDPASVKTVSSWASESGAMDVLAHPLVKDEMIKDEIRNLVLKQEFAAARALAKKTSRNDSHLSNSFFLIAQTLIANFNFPQYKSELDSNLAELLENNDVSLAVIRDLLYPGINPFVVPADIANFQAQYPKIAKTSAFRALVAINSLTKETYASDEEHLVAIRLIDEYLEDVPKERARDLASALLDLAILQSDHPPRPGVASAANKDDQEAIMLALLNYGADIPFSPLMFDAATPRGFYSYTIREGMTNIFQHPTVIDHFKNKDYSDQKAIIDIVGKFNLLGQAPSETDLAIMELLCPYAKKRPTGPLAGAIVRMEVNHLITHIGQWMVTPHDAQGHHRFLKGLGLILKHGLVHDIDLVQPGSYTLPFVHVKTGANYDFYQFIKDNPDLNAGFMKPKRDEELLSLYGLTKAILSQETRSEQVMEKLNRREDFQVKPKQGKPIVYNRYLLKEQMMGCPDETIAEIMSWIDPSRDHSQQRRKITANRLAQIARANLPMDASVGPAVESDTPKLAAS